MKVARDPLKKVLYSEMGNRKLSLFMSQAKIHHKQLAHTHRTIDQELKSMREISNKRVSQQAFIEGIEAGKDHNVLTA